MPGQVTRPCGSFFTITWSSQEPLPAPKKSPARMTTAAKP
jgi:hypothetical protein